MATEGPQFKQDVYHEETAVDLNAAGAGVRVAARSPWTVLKENARSVAVILAIQSNAVIVGIEFALPGNVLGINAFLKEFGEATSSAASGYAVPARTLTIWASLFATFQVLGQFLGGWMSDRFGRRPTLYSVIFWTYIGVTLEVVATNWKVWLGSKIVIGLGTGVMQSVIPTLVSELAPRELRGISLSLFNLAMKWGDDIDDLRAFRVPLYFCLGVPTISLVANLILLPESMWWLALKGKTEAAKKTLVYMYSGQPDFDLERSFAELEYTIAKEVELAQAAKETSYIDCFRGIDARRTFCAIFPPLTQNLTGQNLAGTYATLFFSLAGATDPLISSVITTSVGLAANFFSFFVLESKRVGRWALLFWGLVVMTISMLGIALIDVIGKGEYSDAAGKCLTFFVALFIAASTLGPGVSGWTYCGESGSTKLRAKTATLGAVGNALAGLVFTSVLPYMLDQDQANLGPKTGFMFFGLGVICLVLVYFFIPDFTGRTFSEIDELFARKIKARQFSKTTTTGEYGNNLEGVEIPQGERDLKA